MMAAKAPEFGRPETARYAARSKVAAPLRLALPLLPCHVLASMPAHPESDAPSRAAHSDAAISRRASAAAATLRHALEPVDVYQGDALCVCHEAHVDPQSPLGKRLLPLLCASELMQLWPGAMRLPELRIQPQSCHGRPLPRPRPPHVRA